MAYYLSKYVGKYRVKSEIDLNTNDFPRDANGVIEDCNTYIDCKHGGKIFHYGNNKLECYVPSKQRGRNILKSIGQHLGFDISTYGDPCNYDSLYQDLSDTKFVFDIWESDIEVGWKFRSQDIDVMAEFMKAKTSGSGISPFSTRNLQKRKYDIDNDLIEEYRTVLQNANLDNLLIVAKITNKFIYEIIPKKHKEYKKIDMKALMKKEMLRSKEFIHYLGYWNEYMDFLQKELMR